MRRNPRQQLTGPEWFGDVVVGADLEPDDDVDLLGLRGEDDDRHAQACLANVAADVKPGNVRKHDVEQDQVRLVELDPSHRLTAGLRLDHLIAFFLQGKVDGLADHGLVVHDQDPFCGRHAYQRAATASRGRERARVTPSARGSMTTKTEPLPCRLRTSTWPPSIVTRLRTM